MSNNGIVNIRGKDYMTVAKRVELWHEDTKGNNQPLSIETEVLSHEPVVVVKATVKWLSKSFTGISSANPAKAIEKSNPYEVAETSAVGRALGFAGYGIIEGIASADEMVKAGVTKQVNYGEPDNMPPAIQEESEPQEACPKCEYGHLVDFVTKTGKRARKCSTNRWNANTREAEGCDYIKWNQMTQADL